MFILSSHWIKNLQNFIFLSIILLPYVVAVSQTTETVAVIDIQIYTSKEWSMKKGIHPEFVECQVSCACGNSFVVLSNKSEMRIDICNTCHPFFTGSEKIVDATGRVEKFKNRYKLGK